MRACYLTSGNGRGEAELYQVSAFRRERKLILCGEAFHQTMVRLREMEGKGVSGGIITRISYRRRTITGLNTLVSL